MTTIDWLVLKNNYSHTNSIEQVTDLEPLDSQSNAPSEKNLKIIFYRNIYFFFILS